MADDGIDQQIKIYGPLDKNPALMGAFGVKGGILAPPVPGLVGDLRFNHPTGVGVDKNGNIDVSMGYNTVLESYDPKGKLLWRRLALTFLDCGSIDPASDNRPLYKRQALYSRLLESAGLQLDLYWFHLESVEVSGRSPVALLSSGRCLGAPDPRTEISLHL